MTKKPLKIRNGALVAVLRPQDQTLAIDRLRAIGKLPKAEQLPACDKMLGELPHQFIGLLSDHARWPSVCDYAGNFLTVPKRADTHVNHAAYQALLGYTAPIGTIGLLDIAAPPALQPTQPPAVAEPAQKELENV